MLGSEYNYVSGTGLPLVLPLLTKNMCNFVRIDKVNHVILFRGARPVQSSKNGACFATNFLHLRALFLRTEIKIYLMNQNVLVHWWLVPLY